MSEVLDVAIRTIVEPVLEPGALVLLITAVLAAALAMTARVVAALLEVRDVPSRRRAFSLPSPAGAPDAAGSGCGTRGSGRSGGVARHRSPGAA